MTAPANITGVGTVQDIASRPLAPIVERAAGAFSSISPRPPFLWQWADAAITATTFSSVDETLREPLIALKVCAAILFTAADDVADEVRDPILFRRIQLEVFHGVRPRRGEVRRPQGDVVRRMRAAWRFLLRCINQFPRGPELFALFEFDSHTIIHGQSHSLLVNRMPEASCEEEMRNWTVSSFFMQLFADLDLMCSPGYRKEELGAIREIAGQAQEMCAIANWVGTWERELRAGDFSSAFFGAALRRGVICNADLSRPALTLELVEKLVVRLRNSDLEVSLLERWKQGYCRLDANRGRIQSFDVGRYLAGLEHCLQLQLASRGLV